MTWTVAPQVPPASQSPTANWHSVLLFSIAIGQRPLCGVFRVVVPGVVVVVCRAGRGQGAGRDGSVFLLHLPGRGQRVDGTLHVHPVVTTASRRSLPSL